MSVLFHLSGQLLSHLSEKKRVDFRVDAVRCSVPPKVEGANIGLFYL